MMSDGTIKFVSPFILTYVFELSIASVKLDSFLFFKNRV